MKNSLQYRVTAWLTFLILTLGSLSIRAQQRPDTTFTISLEHPAYPSGKGTLVLIDAAHFNFHTLDNRFSPFGKLVKLDGFCAGPNIKPLTELQPATGKLILVIANALDATDTTTWVLPNPSAFSQEEVENMRQWVLQGGRVLLCADHMPFAGAAGELAAAFGFRFLNGFAFTGERSWPPSKFTREEGTLLSSPVTDTGKNRFPVTQVATFTGSAFTIPDQAIPVLKFKPEHWSLQPDTAWAFHPYTPRVPLDSFYQGALLHYGKGKIAVFGEAAMFTAQIANETIRAGFNSPEAPENAHFVINVIRWLDEDE